MPKLPPFALMNERPPRKVKPQHLAAFFFVFAIPLFFIHLPFLNLPYFWDELGTFVPAALHLLHGQAGAAQSHPPGIAAYLAIFYKVFGFSTGVTRTAMLLLASAGLLVTFLLAIELSRGTKGAPAFLPPIFLLITPLFFTQSMLAQLDMPAMVFTLAALLLFVKEEYALSAAACVLCVLATESGVIPSLAFCGFLAWKKDWKHAAWFLAPVILAGAWLHFGKATIAQFAIAFGRSIFYLFIADLRIVGTAVLIWQAPNLRKTFSTRGWAMAAAIVALNILWVTLLGPAALERHLLPAVALFYIAVSIGLTQLWKPISIAATASMILALALSIRFNPPYPAPLENNYAMVDFLHLQQQAALTFQGHTIATAWPYTTAFTEPEFGFVDRPFQTVETRDFRYSSIKAISPDRFDTLIVYTRQLPASREETITPEQCEELGLHKTLSLSLHGQTVTVYIRSNAP